MVQYGIYLKNIVTKWDFGTSWYIAFRQPAWDVLIDRLLPTVLVNLYSLLFSIPVGIGLGIFAAIKKNKWQDSFISTMVMLFVSIPSYVYAFLVQYFLYFKLGWLPLQVYSLADCRRLVDDMEDVLFHDRAHPGAVLWRDRRSLPLHPCGAD